MSRSAPSRERAPAAAPARTATALWFPRPNAVELRTERLPPVGPHDVRVRAVASAISHGTELLVYRGRAPRDLPPDLPTLRGDFGLPMKYGYASVGRVEETGPAVETPARGDLVFVHHPHQSEYVVDASLCVPLPPGTDPLAGVFLANLETAVNVLLDAAPRIGERVVVLGQGVVGHLVTRLARRAGAALVAVVEPSGHRRALARARGADLAVPPEEARAAIAAATESRGADVAIEASGKGSALALALDLVAFQGTVVVCSWYGTDPVTLPLGIAFHRRRLRVVSSQVSHLDPALAPRWDRTRRTAYAVSLLGELDLPALVTHRFPLERAADAYALVDGQAEGTMQVAFTYE